MFEEIIHNGYGDILCNEAGEDEKPSILSSYFVIKPEFKKCEDSNIKFRIVRGRKGTGKSALLNWLAYIKELEKPSSIIINLKGDDLVAQKKFESLSPSELIFEWKQRICSRINIEIGKRVGIALNDTDISLVEHSEMVGFKGKNIVGALLDRIGRRVGQIQLTSTVPADFHQLLKRYIEKNVGVEVWLLVDDIDATFKWNGVKP